MGSARTLVMTGAGRGIGRVAAEQLLRRDPTTHLLVVARGTGAAALASDLATDGHSVTAVSADLSSIVSTLDACAEIVTMLARVDVPPLGGFVGNAGVQYTDDHQMGVEGLESTFTVNVLANHLFIRALEPHFSPGSHLTVTVSDTHFGDLRHNLAMVPGPRWTSPDRLARPAAFPKPTTTRAGRTAYSTSKLAAIYLVHEWARRLPSNVDIVSFNPGFVPGTGLARDAGPISRFLMSRVLPALTLLSIATSPGNAGRLLADAASRAIAAETGSYIDRSRIVRSSDESYAPDRETQIWETCEHLAREFA